MKNTKRWVAVLLCLACIFLLAACGGSAEKLVGRWGFINDKTDEYKDAYWEFTEYGTFTMSDGTTDYATGTYYTDGNKLYITATGDDEIPASFDMFGKHLTIYMAGEAVRLIRK